MTRQRRPRRYRLTPAYTAPDLVHAAVFASIATSKAPVKLPELAERVGPSTATPDRIASVLRSLIADGWIEEQPESRAIRQPDGQLSVFTMAAYRLGPKGSAHV